MMAVRGFGKTGKRKSLLERARERFMAQEGGRFCAGLADEGKVVTKVYIGKDGKEHKRTVAAKGYKKSPAAVKRPATGYMLFLKDHAGELAGLKVAERGRLGGEMWRALSAGEKAEYNGAAKAAFAEYKTVPAADRCSGVVEKAPRALSAWNLFVKAHYKREAAILESSMGRKPKLGEVVSVLKVKYAQGSGISAQLHQKAQRQQAAERQKAQLQENWDSLPFAPVQGDEQSRRRRAARFF